MENQQVADDILVKGRNMDFCTENNEKCLSNNNNNSFSIKYLNQVFHKGGVNEIIRHTILLNDIKDLALIISEMNKEANMHETTKEDNEDLKWYLDNISNLEDIAIYSIKNSEMNDFEFLHKRYKSVEDKLLNSQSFKSLGGKIIIHYAKNDVLQKSTEIQDGIQDLKCHQRITRIAEELNDKFKAGAMEYTQSVIDTISTEIQKMYAKMNERFDVTLRHMSKKLGQYESLILNMQKRIKQYKEYARQKESYQKIKDAIKSVTSKNEIIDQNYDLIIRMDKEKGTQLVRMLTSIFIPPIHVLSIQSFPLVFNKNAKKILENGFPSKLNTFYFNFSSSSLISGEYYLRGALPNFSGITSKIGISSGYLTIDLLNKLISNSYNCHTIRIERGVILSSDCDFDFTTESQYKTKLINLYETGFEDTKKWGSDLHR